MLEWEPSKIEDADRSIAQAAAPARKTAPVKVLGWLSEVADQPQLITLCAGVLGAGVLMRDERLARAGARMLAAELLATALKNFVKHRVDRSRPRVPADGGPYQMHAGDSDDSDLNSFPSGHTAGAIAVAQAFAREYPAHRLGTRALAAAIAAIQVPRAQHYVSDIAAGALIGVAAEAVVDQVAALADRRSSRHA